MTILIQNGQVINPATGMNEVADVLVEMVLFLRLKRDQRESRPEDQCEGMFCHAGIY